MQFIAFIILQIYEKVLPAKSKSCIVQPLNEVTEMTWLLNNICKLNYVDIEYYKYKKNVCGVGGCFM